MTEPTDQHLPDQEQNISRRAVLMGLGGLGGLSILNKSLCLDLSFLPQSTLDSGETDTAQMGPPAEFPSYAVTESEPASREGNVLLLGSLDQFPAGSITHYRHFANGRFYLIRFTDGAFLAIQQTCTHQGCGVRWTPENRHFECPCHGSIYDINGLNTAGPAPRPLSIYPISTEDGQVRVDITAPVPREQISESDHTF